MHPALLPGGHHGDGPPARPELPPSAPVVIIGGGVMGASAAFHLAEAGVGGVLLLERGRLAAGSSGKPIGGVRAQFSDPLNIDIAARSLRAYRGFRERVGTGIGLDRAGYLFLLTRPDDAAAFERAVALQNTMGLPNRMVGPAEAGRLCRYAAAPGLLCAAYSPEDGHARPVRVVEGYARAAERAGAAVRTGCTVTGIGTEGGRVAEVHTTAGTVRTGAVVCAAGAWSAGIGAMAGVELPVRPLRRQIAFTRPMRPRPPRIPFTIDFASSAYFHNSDDGMLFGMSDPRQEEGFDTSYSEEWLAPFRGVLRERAPELAGLPVAGGWAGLYETTPDHNALIGADDRVGGFLYATGFSGHGFLQAPAVGEIVRDLFLGRTPPVDIAPLTAARFTSGAQPRPEAAIV
ncbi:NAD(P)/FAD-dependent oxidoreductase [Nocardiopsis composta]|nr:FAD-binding oxidoreductase [Nocardiopsis composta]